MIAIKRKRKLKCSFCGKSDKEVTRLVGGPGIFICDACIGICNKVLEATPIAFPGWQAMTDDQLLGALKIAEATVDATRAVLRGAASPNRRAAEAGSQLGYDRQCSWDLTSSGMGTIFVRRDARGPCFLHLPPRAPIRETIPASSASLPSIRRLATRLCFRSSVPRSGQRRPKSSRLPLRSSRIGQCTFIASRYTRTRTRSTRFSRNSKSTPPL